MERAEALRRSELSKTLKKMPHLSEQDVDKIEALSGALVRKLLHHPIVAIKKMGSTGYTQLSREFLCLDSTGPDTAGCHLDGASWDRLTASCNKYSVSAESARGRGLPHYELK